MQVQDTLPKVILIHPGTQHSNKLAEQLSKRKYLLYFYTGLAISSKSILYKFWKLLPLKIKRKTSNRIVQDLKPKELKLIPFYELKALRQVKEMKKNDDIFFGRNKKFQHKISIQLLEKANAIIGFDTSSWIIADKAVLAKKPLILDVSIAHSKSKEVVYKSINSLYPKWGFNLDFKEEKYLVIEELEYQKATAIVVASRFTKETLTQNGVDPKKIFINPYGVDLSKFVYHKRLTKKTIQFLFVGIVDARKGIPFLLKVWEKFKGEGVSLTLLGPVTDNVKTEIMNYGYNNVTIAGRVPHSELPGIMGKHDVFIFPSFFEGFGLVILEALACGMPVITTTATAGPDLINNGKEGFVIEPGDEMALEKSLQFFIDNPDQIYSMGKLAVEKAKKYDWDKYGERWIQIINEVTNFQTK